MTWPPQDAPRVQARFEDPSEPPPPPPRPRSRWVRYLVASMLVLVGLLVADGIFVALRLRSSLQTVADRLDEARRNFDADDLSPTRVALDDALVAASDARGLIGHPAFRLASLLPVIGDDTRAIEDLSEAAELSARAGVAGLQALDAAVGSEESSLARSVYRDGVVDFRAADRAAPKVREAARLLAEAEAILASTVSPRFGAVGDALDTARDRVSQASDSMDKGVALLDGLPGLFGRDGTKEYFLAFLSPSEARGVGGLPGVYGVLRAKNGRLSLGKVRPIGSLGAKNKASVAPGWFKDLYGDAGALRDARQAAYSPEFPTVAQLWLEMHEAATGQMLDGVIAMDPVAFAEMTKGTGPISAPGLEREVGPDNAVETLLYDSYVDFDDPLEQNRYLGGLVNGLWTALGTGSVDAEALASGMAAAAQGQHLKVYATEARDQDALVRLEIDGTYSDEGANVQLVFNNNAGANKIDYFLKRSVDTTVTLQGDGSALVETVIEMDNSVPPDAPDSLVFGPGIEGDEIGDNGMVASMLMPQSSQLRSLTIDAERSPALQGREGEYPVAYDLVVLPPGEVSVVEVTYLMRDAWDPKTGDFDFVLYPQATVTPDAYTITVIAPDNAAITLFDGDESDGEARVSSSGTLDRVRAFHVQIEG